MRTDAEAGFQVLGVHEQRREFVAVAAQPEEHADAHVVAAAFLGAVHRLGVPFVVALGAGGMQRFVLLAVVGFLEENIGADAGLLEFPVRFHVRGGDIHVDAADGVAAFPDGIDGLDGVEDVFQRIVPGIFAGFHGQALVPDTDEGAHFFGNLFLRQFLAGDAAVLGVVGTVDTAVDAIVR